jgi:acyl-CoA dehydrogenase
VPADRLAAGPAAASDLEARWEAGESLRTASRVIGLLERGARMARDYARQRVTFGQPLSNRQAIQWKLVDAEMDIYSSRWVVRNALAAADNGTLRRDEAAKARHHVLNAAWRSIDEVLQVFGGIGFTQDMPIEAMWRNIRVQLDRFGSADQTRQLIASGLIDS